MGLLFLMILLTNGINALTTLLDPYAKNNSKTIAFPYTEIEEEWNRRRSRFLEKEADQALSKIIEKAINTSQFSWNAIGIAFSNWNNKKLILPLEDFSDEEKRRFRFFLEDIILGGSDNRPQHMTARAIVREDIFFYRSQIRRKKSSH